MCLDMYWSCDMTKSVLSRETPHFPLPVTEERMAPGAGGNALNNMATLSKNVSAIGITGDDWRGFCLKKCFEERGINTEYIIEVAGRITNAYCKPMRKGYLGIEVEDPRLDFESFSPLSTEIEDQLIEKLKHYAATADVLCVSDQMTFGCITPRIREALCRMGENGKTIIVDSRNHCAEYHHVIIKPNEVESARAFAGGQALEIPELSGICLEVSRKQGCPALITLGSEGCLVACDGEVFHAPACRVPPPIDFCGAGDTFLSGFASLLSAGASPLEAAQIANLCSAVTIQKIGTTGTACRREVLTAWDTFWA
jgi:rfaE bifunctional protein kinase chain/domain